MQPTEAEVIAAADQAAAVAAKMGLDEPVIVLPAELLELLPTLRAHLEARGFRVTTEEPPHCHRTRRRQ